MRITTVIITTLFVLLQHHTFNLCFAEYQSYQKAASHLSRGSASLPPLHPPPPLITHPTLITFIMVVQKVIPSKKRLHQNLRSVLRRLHQAHQNYLMDMILSSSRQLEPIICEQFLACTLPSDRKKIIYCLQSYQNLSIHFFQRLSNHYI